MRKLDRERALLEVVYDAHEFTSIEHRDKPDFLLTRRKPEYKFGVEITEIFETESHARLHFHPEYIERLFAGARPMHRDDEKELALSRVSISDPDGNPKASDVPAIIRETRPTVERYSAVARRLQEKERKLDGYEHLGHTNLIIADQCGQPSEVGPDGQYNVSDLLVPALRSALGTSRFREVFLVSMMRDGKIKYRPLHQLMLLEKFFVFCRACAVFDGWAEGAYPLNEDAAVLFAWVQSHSGWPVSLYERAGGTFAAMYRGSGAALGRSSVEILDFYDFPSPPAVPPAEPPVDRKVLRNFTSFYTSFADENMFSCKVFIPARNTPPLAVVSEGF